MAQTSVVPILLGLVTLAAGIGSLVCFIMVLIQMFNRGEQTIGIVCIVLAFCTGIGALIAFVYGWTKASEWGIQKVMVTWTACILANIVLVILYMALFFVVAAQQGQMQ